MTDEEQIMTDVPLTQEQKDKQKKMSEQFNNIIKNIPTILEYIEHSSIDFGNKADYFYHVDEWAEWDPHVYRITFWHNISSSSVTVAMHEKSLNAFIVEYISSLSKADIRKIIGNIWIETETEEG
jgi:hypothetical protein